MTKVKLCKEIIDAIFDEITYHSTRDLTQQPNTSGSGGWEFERGKKNSINKFYPTIFVQKFTSTTSYQHSSIISLVYFPPKFYCYIFFHPTILELRNPYNETRVRGSISAICLSLQNLKNELFSPAIIEGWEGVDCKLKFYGDGVIKTIFKDTVVQH